MLDQSPPERRSRRISLAASEQIRTYRVAEPVTVTWDGAPVALTFCQSTDNDRPHAAFLFRGHLDSAGMRVPGRVARWTGAAGDRGMGTLKSLRLLFVDRRRDLVGRLRHAGRATPRVLPPARDVRRSE